MRLCALFVCLSVIKCVSVCAIVSFHLLGKRSAETSDCVLLSVQDVDVPVIRAEATTSLPYFRHSCFTKVFTLNSSSRVQVCDFQYNNVCCMLQHRESRLIWDQYMKNRSFFQTADLCPKKPLKLPRCFDFWQVVT